MEIKQIIKELSSYRINVYKKVLCPVTLNRKWRYATVTENGFHGHFNTKEDLLVVLFALAKMRVRVILHTA
jgi:hypothetical protein